MQFAGQRTDEDLKPLGKPDNLLIKLADDVLPEPDAILVHKITPQKTVEEGITEAEFAEYFQDKVATPDTVFIGFNNIRFDDEFMRRIMYRTFHDPYQWHWKDGRSRWDMLDPIRMMRALRPEGLKWPMLDDKPTVKLEMLAKENGFIHENAHDALSDVEALIQITESFKKHQPKLFSYLLNVRDKKVVKDTVLSGAPFVYTSGKYSGQYEKTTVVHTVLKHPRRDGVVVYNLREDPEKWFDKSVEELVTHWTARYGDGIEQLPVKTLQFNRCPAIAPLGVLDDDSQQRIHIDLEEIERNYNKLTSNSEFREKLSQALDIIEKVQQTSLELDDAVDYQMYDGFWVDADQKELQDVRMADVDELPKLSIRNKRIRDMVPLYIARNYPNKLTPELREVWEKHRQQVFYGHGTNSKFSKFSKRMQELSKSGLNKDQKYLLTELQLYAESILPEPHSD